MDLLGSIMGKMDSGPPKSKQTAQQTAAIDRSKKMKEDERKKREYMTKKIEQRILKFVAEVNKESEKLKASDDPEECERIPKLFKLNFKPMDDVWRSTVHEMAQDQDLPTFSVGRGEERYVCVCSRQPTNQEMREIKGITPSKTETDETTKKESKTADCVATKVTATTKGQTYTSKYSHLIGTSSGTSNDAVKVGADPTRSFGLVSASLKRDTRTIEETQRAIQSKKIRKSLN